MNQAKNSEDFRQKLINSHQLNCPFPQVTNQASFNGSREVIKVKRGGKQGGKEKSNDLNSTLSTSFSSSSSAVMLSNNLTNVQPFNLSFNYRPKKVVSFNEPVQKFVARKAPHVEEPFKPLLGTTQTTKTDVFSFATQSRAEKRDIFEERIKNNIRNREAEALMKKQMEEEIERERVKRIRKQMEFKALPLPSVGRASDRNDIRSHSEHWGLNRCNLKK
jgi:hypothetical protein